MNKKKSRHHGSRLDDLLRKEGVLEQLRAVAVNEVKAWQIPKAMKERRLSKLRRS